VFAVEGENGVLSVEDARLLGQVLQLHCRDLPPERESFIDNLLVRIHFIIVMIRWTGLAQWEFEFRFPGAGTCRTWKGYRGTSIIRNTLSVRPYSSFVPRDPW